MSINFYKSKSSWLPLVIVLIIGLVVGGVVSYFVPAVFLEPSSKVQEISLADVSIKESGNTLLKIPVANNDPNSGHTYTVTVQTDSSISVYIGDTLLPRTGGIYTHTFFLDSRDSLTKNYIVHAGTLPEPTTSVSFNIAVKIYVDNESKPIAQKDLEITIKK